jgi:hypothetical protein
MPSLGSERAPDVDGTSPGATLDRQLRERVKVETQLVELGRLLRRPQKFHDNDRADRNVVDEDPGLKVVVDRR